MLLESLSVRRTYRRTSSSCQILKIIIDSITALQSVAFRLHFLVLLLWFTVIADGQVEGLRWNILLEFRDYGGEFLTKDFYLRFIRLFIHMEIRH